MSYPMVCLTHTDEPDWDCLACALSDKNPAWEDETCVADDGEPCVLCKGMSGRENTTTEGDG